MRSQNTAAARTEDTAGELLDSILDCVLPIVKRTICQVMVDGGLIIQNEKPLEALPKRDELLPIKVLTLQADQRDFVKLKTVRNIFELNEQLREHPEFDWKSDLRSLYDQKKLLVLDILDLKFRFEFQDGVELTFPLGDAWGIGKTAIEIGSDMNKGEKRDGEGKDKVAPASVPRKPRIVLHPALAATNPS